MALTGRIERTGAAGAAGSVTVTANGATLTLANAGSVLVTETVTIAVSVPSVTPSETPRTERSKVSGPPGLTLRVTGAPAPLPRSRSASDVKVRTTGAWSPPAPGLIVTG